jgi:hypothetical protein
MTKRVIWYVGLGVLCLGLIAVVVNAAGSGKQTGKFPTPASVQVSMPAGNPSQGSAQTAPVSGMVGREEIPKWRRPPVNTPVSAPEEKALPKTPANEEILRTSVPGMETVSEEAASGVGVAVEEPSSVQGRNPLDAPCTVTYNTGSLNTTIYARLSQAGDAAWTFVKPSNNCFPTAYNFRIDSVQVGLYFPAGTTTGQFTYDIVVRCPNVPGDSCSMPGPTVLYSQRFTYLWPGTPIAKVVGNVFTTPVCINGPVFVGLVAVSYSGTGFPCYACEAGTVVPASCQYFYSRGWPQACDWTTVTTTPRRFYTKVYGYANQLTCTPVACTDNLPACVVTCQAGDSIEADETADSTWMHNNDPNSGCAGTGPRFGRMYCGRWMCGKTFDYKTTSYYFRDQDWYLITLTEPDSLIVTVNSEIPITVSIMDTNSCSTGGTVIVSATSSGPRNCTVVLGTGYCMYAGTYAVMIEPAGFFCPLAPTSAKATYRAKVDCYACGAVSCTPDYTIHTNDFPLTICGTTVGAHDNCTMDTSWHLEMGGEDVIIKIIVDTPRYYRFSFCDSSLCAHTGLFYWDMKVALTTQCCGGTLVGSSDDGCYNDNGTPSNLCTPLLEPGEYYLTIESWGRPPSYPYHNGPFAMHADTCIPCTPAPPNDDCHNAVQLTVNDPNPYCGVKNACASVDFPCDPVSSPDVWCYFDLPTSEDNCYNVKIKYCGTGSEMNSLIVELLKDSCCGEAMARDTILYDCPSGLWFIGYWDSLAPGRYYVPIASFYPGSYCVQVQARSCRPCVVCPNGATQENEPLCGTGYVDTYNGGCNSVPPIFSNISFGQTVCGKSGIWLDGTTLIRDLDFYQFQVTQPGYVTWNVFSQFATLTQIIQPGSCNPSIRISQGGAQPCDTLKLVSPILLPGTYAAMVTADFAQGVTDCNTPYVATLTFTAADTMECLETDTPECTEVADSTNGDFDCNGGCNNDPFPHLYSTIACGQSICGRAFRYTGGGYIYLDSDWYRFHLAAPQTIRVSAEAEFPFFFAITDTACSDINYLANGSCPVPRQNLSIQASLPAGDYNVYFRADDSYMLTSFMKYRVTLGCPCVEAKDATAYMNSTLDGVVIRWQADVAEPYDIYRTLDFNGAWPADFTLVGTVNAVAGTNSWTDPDEPLTDSYARYVVVHNCP